MKRARKPVVILKATPADENNQVVTIQGGAALFRKEPCPGCPWKKKNDGNFPAEAFRISAPTSYDMADRQFGCHESGKEKPATCAGFLLRNSANNLASRLSVSRKELDYSQIEEGPDELHDSYKEMAIANGVDPDDPVLARCRHD